MKYPPKFSFSLAIRKIKITWNFILRQPEWQRATQQATTNGGGEQGKGLSFTAGGAANWCSYPGHQGGEVLKELNKSTMWATPGHVSQGLESLLHRYLLSHAHCWPSHNSREMQTTYRSFSQWLDGGNVVHTPQNTNQLPGNTKSWILLINGWNRKDHIEVTQTQTDKCHIFSLIRGS